MLAMANKISRSNVVHIAPPTIATYSGCGGLKWGKIGYSSSHDEFSCAGLKFITTAIIETSGGIQSTATTAAGTLTLSCVSDGNIGTKSRHYNSMSPAILLLVDVKYNYSHAIYMSLISHLTVSGCWNSSQLLRVTPTSNSTGISKGTLSHPLQLERREELMYNIHKEY